MANVSLGQLQARLTEIEARKTRLEWKSNHAQGKLARHEVWRHAYLSFPYLIGAPDDRVGERFRDIFINTNELTNEGKISPRLPIADDDFTQKFTHMLEEYGARGAIPADVVAAARAPILRYFEHGDPIAMKMLDGYTPPPAPILVKYGRREFLEPMLRHGNIRVCPASFYNDHALLASVKDDEISRTFHIPTFKERIAGQSFIDVQGNRISFGDDDISLPVVVPDYYLFSLCDEIYYRLPTDFGADAALIIRDPSRFSQSVIAHFLARRPEWKPMYGPITYYDPYRDYGKVRVPEMSKHFGYSYQREVRIAFRTNQRQRVGLQPEHLKIGSINEYAELIYA